MSLCASSQIARSQNWNELETLRRNYTTPVFSRDGACHIATLQEVTSRSLTILWQEPENRQMVARSQQISKQDILSVGNAHEVLYSGRSSWRDVQDAKPAHGESLDVTTVTGESYSGSVHAISTTELTLGVRGRKKTFEKSNIRTVTYVRQRPYSDSEEYLAQEAAYLMFFWPDTWRRAAGLGPKLHVMLYDSSLPEDDSELKCDIVQSVRQ